MWQINCITYIAIEIKTKKKLNVFLVIVADIISTVEFNHNGDLLATGDKGGRIVIFQKDNAVSGKCQLSLNSTI